MSKTLWANYASIAGRLPCMYLRIALSRSSAARHLSSRGLITTNRATSCLAIYERLSLIVTTKMSFEQWTEVMRSVRLSGAMLDRLTYRVHLTKPKPQPTLPKPCRNWPGIHTPHLLSPDLFKGCVLSFRFKSRH